MEFPRYHKDIVSDLMAGKFILASDPKFISLKDSTVFYEKFFKESFGFALEIKSDYGFILSYETGEQLSRDICMFFAILCYELDRDGKNFLEEIQYAEFEHEKLDEYFENSVYGELIANNNQLKSGESRRDFIKTLNRRNIVERNGDGKFTFTRFCQREIGDGEQFDRLKLHSLRGRLFSPGFARDNHYPLSIGFLIRGFSSGALATCCLREPQATENAPGAWQW